MKILYVAQSFYPKVGGVENYIDSIATAMAKKGHEVFVFAPEYPSVKKHPKGFEIRNGYTIIRADFHEHLKRGILYHLRPINLMPSFLKALRLIRPDVVHFQYTNPFGVYLKFTKLKGIKCFATVHGNDILFYGNDWFARRILRFILIFMDGVFAVSDHSRQLLLEIGGKPDKVYTVYNGTDPKKFIPKPSKTILAFKNKKRILTVCRLVERKGVDVLIKAFNIVHQRVESDLYIVGDGPYRPELKSLVSKLNLTKDVHIMGKVPGDQLVNYYNSCDVFALMSRVIPEENEIEGFGISIVEAMACGKPVLGGASGGIPSAIKGDWGFVIDPLDYNKLAEKIIYLFENPEVAQKMGLKGRCAVERVYNWDAVADKLLGFYQ